MQNFNAEINHVQKKIYYIIIKDKYIFLQFAIHATRVFQFDFFLIQGSTINTSNYYKLKRKKNLLLEVIK